MTKYWISVRQIQGDKFTNKPDLGSTRYLKIPDGEVPKPAHQIPVKQWVQEIVGLFEKNSDDQPTGDILFFVHGYNDLIDEVDQRHKLLQAGLTENNFFCPVLSFDWACGTNPLAYLRDRDNARLTAVRLVSAGIKLFVNAQALDCDINVHVLGHSTGAFVVREAFDHADDGQSTATNWTAGQLVLISGDVSYKSFSANDPETESTYRHCYRLTNYSNGYDEVLQVSNVKRVGVAPRVGRAGLPADAPVKGVNVDCSNYFHQTFGSSNLTPAYATLSHSWQFADKTFHADLAVTLRGAIDRLLIPTRKKDTGELQKTP